jgi:metal-responsive CopG/Arc/MetJ family transcriptional regulator
MKNKKEKIIKPKISFPLSLLTKVDRLAKKAGMDRSKYVCTVIEAKMFADEMKAAYGEST